MRDNSDNTSNARNLRPAHVKRRGRHMLRHARYARRSAMMPDQSVQPQGFDPELLYVECEKCGSPVLWGEGKASRMLAEAGIDPLELDQSCLLVTDGCPVCGLREEYAVRILRSGIRKGFMPVHGHA